MSKSIAFVTGATGLLGNNLVRLLLERGWTVKALARSTEKAEKQFNGLEVQVVQGDMTNVEQFASELIGVNAVFHTAAYFRESFLGGSHWNELYVSNVLGTRRLLDAAYDAGVRKFVQTSSIAVLNGPRGAVIDESMSRPANDGDDYYRSKILADQEVSAFLSSHPDFFAVFVLPGWMHGPGDSGPTQAGQTTLDFVKRKLPGIPPGTVSVVDARDVGLAMIAALERGKRGERYLSAGRNMDMKGVFSELQEVTGIPAPRRKLPLFMLYFIAAIQELRARLTKAPALLSWATVRLMVRENGRSTFSDQKLREELGVQFRPVRETLRDEVEWYREHGWLNTASEASR
jgi:dihydroflavonol-4-reductase